MLTSLRRKSEFFLLKQGFTSPVVRELLFRQMLVVGVSLVVSLPLTWSTLWPLLFCTGATLALYNFWHTARFAEQHIRQAYTPMLGVSLFFGFTGRLLLTGVVLAALVIWLLQPVTPLVLGLTSSVVVITAWGGAKVSRKPVKEA